MSFITIDQARQIPAFQFRSPEQLRRLVHRSGVQIQRRGRCIEFEREPFIEWFAGRQFWNELSKGSRGDWYTRQLAREERKRV